MSKKQSHYQDSDETPEINLSFFQQIALLKLSAYFRQSSQMLDLLGEHTGNIKGLLRLSRIDQIEIAEELIKRMEKIHHTSGEILNLTKAELQTHKLKIELEQYAMRHGKTKKKVQNDINLDQQESKVEED
jgi:hypothetical protein